MRDIFSEGLLYLDLLEIYGSTYAVAEICGIAQSNVFRGASSCSKLLNLGLTKDKQSGAYSVERNHDVQRDLRKLNQKMRARENGQLRLVGAETLLKSSPISLEQARNYQPLPERWQSKDISLQYLEKSLLDVVITKASQVRPKFRWPPPVRRRDLFVPIDTLAATELCELPLVLLAPSNHPLIAQASLDDTCKLEWLVDKDLSLELVREAYPAARLCPWQDDAITDAMAYAEIQANPNLLWLTDSRRLSDLESQDPSFNLLPLSLELGLMDYLLAISLPGLVVEPMHQSLIRHLRELANRMPSANTGLPGRKCMNPKLA
jgi:hypothetical protein